MPPSPVQDRAVKCRTSLHRTVARPEEMTDCSNSTDSEGDRWWLVRSLTAFGARVLTDGNGEEVNV